MAVTPPERRLPVPAYIALGANLGDAVGAVRRAMTDIGRIPRTEVLARSSLYLTAPIDSSGPDYVNAVVAVSTGLCAPALLTALQAIEQAAGRLRPYPNAPRTLDLDILLYGEAVVQSGRLTLPHPRMAARAFVLLPLAEVASDRVCTQALQDVSGQSVRRMGD